MTKAVGLITEYNPFHNGHLHHLREGLKVTGAEVAVALMSGHFLQRGEPALLDKWCRTEMALAAGVDVVIELPLPWACSSAPDFARGGVEAFNALGGIDTLCFGSEAGEIESLGPCAEILLAKEQTIVDQTATLLREGLNYPRARARVLAEMLPEGVDVAALAAPNNILGIEYIKALRQTGSGSVPFTIQRCGAGYHDRAVGENNIASATGIRKRLAQGEDVGHLLPRTVWPLLRQALNAGHSYLPERYFPLLLAQLLRDPAGLVDCWLVADGIENRLFDIAQRATDLEELIGGIKSRQLTRTRIQRLLVAILLGIRHEEATGLLTAGPRYLHLLGASAKGERFLARSRKQRSIPLIQNFSRVHATLKRRYGVASHEYELARRQLDLERRATELYTLLMKHWSGGHRQRDFFEQLRRV